MQVRLELFDHLCTAADFSFALRLIRTVKVKDRNIVRNTIFKSNLLFDSVHSRLQNPLFFLAGGA